MMGDPFKFPLAPNATLPAGRTRNPRMFGRRIVVSALPWARRGINKGAIHPHRHFDGIEALVEHYISEDVPLEDRPDWAWCCNPVEFELRPDMMLEAALEHMYEDAGDRISVADYKELHDFVETWARKQSLVSYEVDYSRYILIDRKAFVD